MEEKSDGNETGYEEGIYLGNSLILGRNKMKEFRILKEMIQRRLEWWKRKTLYKARKAVLIKSVLQAIPAYTMSIFKVPLGICNSLDNILKKF